jgi:polysaccharide export outer membrane protein
MSSRRLIHAWRARPIVVVALLMSVGACSDGGRVGPSLPASAIGARDLLAYQLNAGDKVKLTVFGEPDLSGVFEINGLGRISLPLVGDVKAAGLDLNGLRDAIARRLADGYLKNPRVTVEVAGYRPIYVHGEVRSGGEFAYKTGLRLRDVVALAGGYTYRANQNYVVLSRAGTGQDVQVQLPNDLIVMPGDNIRVPERFF